MNSLLGLRHWADREWRDETVSSSLLCPPPPLSLLGNCIWQEPFVCGNGVQLRAHILFWIHWEQTHRHSFNYLIKSKARLYLQKFFDNRYRPRVQNDLKPHYNNFETQVSGSECTYFNFRMLTGPRGYFGAQVFLRVYFSVCYRMNIKKLLNSYISEGRCETHRAFRYLLPCRYTASMLDAHIKHEVTLWVKSSGFTYCFVHLDLHAIEIGRPYMVISVTAPAVFCLWGAASQKKGRERS